MKNWISDEDFDFKTFLAILYPFAEKSEIDKMYNWTPNKSMEEQFGSDLSELYKDLGVKTLEQLIKTLEKIFKN